MSTSRAQRLGGLVALLLFVACSKADQGETSSAEQSAVERDVTKTVQVEPAADPEPFPGAEGEAKERQQAGPERPAEAEPLEEDMMDAPAPSAAPQSGAGRGALELGKSRDSSASKKKKKRKKGSKATSKKAPAKPSGGAASMPKQEAPREDAERAVADPERLIANLSSLEAQLRSAGIRLPQDAGSDKDGNQPENYDCDKVCELQGAICGLQERICDLASAHPEDDRYARACQRATGDCRVARQACSACE